MIKKIISLLCSVLLTLCLFSSCKKDGNNGTAENSSESENPASSDFSFTDNDLDASYDKNSAKKIDVSETHTITKGGTYILSGNLTDKAFSVEVSKEEKVRLVLNNVSVNNSTGPALLIKSAKKVFLILEDNTENTFSDASNYNLTEDGSSVDAAIFSKEKLTINGNGKLTVNGNYKHAIVSKDDVVVASGTLDITSKGVGILGKDSVKFANPDIKINAGTDAIRGDNADDANLGFVYIQNGTYNLVAKNDAIQSSSIIKIADGKINASAGSDIVYNPESEESQKGLKASSDIIIKNGSIRIDSTDDSINSEASVTISGGTINLATADDAIHADNAIEISDGTINVVKSNEGFESGKISVSGGKIDLTSTDDGINITDAESSFSISDGYIYIRAGGDGIDSNGAISISGGVTLISGPENNGNGSFDYSTKASVTGGILVALGSNGMMQNFSQAENQGAILYTFKSGQPASTSFALCDSENKVIVSFTPEKSYSCALVTAPEIKENNSYKIVTGITVKDTDVNGYVHNGTGSGGTVQDVIEMTSSLYGKGSMMGGAMPGGHGGGMGERRPDGERPDPNGNVPEKPQGRPDNEPGFFSGM